MIEAVQSYAEANIDQPLSLFKGTPLRPISYIDLTIFDQATDAGKQFVETTERVGEVSIGVDFTERVIGAND